MTMAGPHHLPAVPQGPRAFRSRIRRIGPLAALLPALLLALVSSWLLRGNTSTARGIAGFGAIVLAAPALLAAGVPLTTEASRKTLGVLVSIVIWLVIGLIASRRATRSPVAMWRDYWREFAWLAAGVWIGVVIGLALTEVLVGRALL